MEQVRKIRQARRNRNAKVIHVVELGIRPRKNRRMRRGGQGDLRVGTRENDSLPGQRVEVRRKPAIGTEKTHAVGTRGIERDENDVRRPRRGFGCGSVLRRTGGAGGGEQEKKREPPGKPHTKRGVYHRQTPRKLPATAAQKMNFSPKFMFLGPPCAITGLPAATSEVFAICPKFPPPIGEHRLPIRLEGAQEVRMLLGK